MPHVAGIAGSGAVADGWNCDVVSASWVAEWAAEIESIVH